MGSRGEIGNYDEILVVGGMTGDDWYSIFGKALYGEIAAKAPSGLKDALGPKSKWEGRFEFKVHLPLKDAPKNGPWRWPGVRVVTIDLPVRIDVSKEIRAFARAAKKERRDRRRGTRALKQLTKGLTWVGGPGPLDTSLYTPKSQWRKSKSFKDKKGKRK